MILPALVQYYDLLAQDPETDIAPYGFSRQKIAFEVVLTPTGELHAVADARIQQDDWQRPRLLVVPGQAKPSGSGIHPCLLWDNAQYMLGFKAEDTKPDRTTKAFEAFRSRHLILKAELRDPSFDAVCAFLENWTPERAREVPDVETIAAGFGVFRILGTEGYVHERPTIQAWWAGQLAASEPSAVDADETPIPTLITGRPQPIARLHKPKIKGVRDAQSSGATLVSYNQNSFESYGKNQGDNAPIGVEEAFKYCTALNHLTRDPNRCVHLGSTTIVFWAEQESTFETDLMPAFLIGGTGEDQQAAHDIRNAMRALTQGRAVRDIHPETPFYVLGLAPNAARLSVRLWLVATIGMFAGRIASHLDDLSLEPTPESPDLTIRRIIAETAPPKSGWADEGAVSPLLTGAVLRAVLSGGAYPQALLAAVVERARTEGLADSETRKDWFAAQHRRCAIIKACLLRAARAAGQPKEIPVSLNEDHPDPAYHLGRLFAAFEHVQTDALGRNLNTTIKDRYFGSASSTPAAVFPRLTKLHQHHMDKLDGGLRVVREKLIQDIFGRIDSFPAHLALNDQGLFSIGYYHQRQALFTKKSEQPEATTA